MIKNGKGFIERPIDPTSIEAVPLGHPETYEGERRAKQLGACAFSDSIKIGEQAVSIDVPDNVRVIDFAAVSEPVDPHETSGLAEVFRFDVERFKRRPLERR